MGRQSSDIMSSPPSGPSRQPVPDDCAGGGSAFADSLPKLRELREDVFFRAEYQYLHNLIGMTGRNIQCACQVSGLSRSRLYSLLKKYQITTPFHTPCHQK